MWVSVVGVCGKRKKIEGGGRVTTAYDFYANSRIDFLGKLPQSWRVTRIANIFVEQRIVGYSNEVLLSIDRHRGIIKQSQTGRKVRAPQDRNSYKLIEPGQLGYNIFNAFMGGIGISRYRGIVSPIYIVARFRGQQNPWYFHYLLRTRLYQQQFSRLSYGIMHERNSLYYGRFKTIPVPVPPLSEQTQIAHYLRTKDTLITRFLCSRRALVARLKEYKLRLIDHAVTDGLNPNAARKSSGVQWLGDVPAHWRVLKLKFATKKIVGGSTPQSHNPAYWDGGIVWITPRDISKNYFLYSSQRTISAAGLQSCATTIVPPQSIVVTCRAPVGNVAIARVALCTNQGCKAIVLAPEVVISEYLFLFLLRMKARLQMLANGTTFSEIGTWTLANEYIAIPPLAEQQAIVSHLQREGALLDARIARFEKEITLISEYRQRLIQDAVTGQIDLRAWQPPARELH